MNWGQNKKILIELIEELFNPEDLFMVKQYIHRLLTDMERIYRYKLQTDDDYLQMNKKILYDIHQQINMVSSQQLQNEVIHPIIKPLKSELNTMKKYEDMKTQYYDALTVKPPPRPNFEEPLQTQSKYAYLKDKILKKKMIKEHFSKELETIPEVDIESDELETSNSIDKKLEQLMIERQNI